MESAVNLEWNPTAIDTFKIKLHPYVKGTKCSVHNCDETATHMCKYSLESKIYSKLLRRKIYPKGSQREFYYVSNIQNVVM
jgi:hypothetical protein